MMYKSIRKSEEWFDRNDRESKEHNLEIER